MTMSSQQVTSPRQMKSGMRKGAQAFVEFAKEMVKRIQTMR